jgi:hypothetical protein
MIPIKRLPNLVSSALFCAAAAIATAQVAPLHLRFEYDGGTVPNKPKPAGQTLAIGTITDIRQLEDGTRVGDCEAVSPTATPVTTLIPVPEFVKQALEVSLAKWKVNVSPDADRVLRTEVLKFWVVETGRFEASVRFRFVLEDRVGTVLWEGEKDGDDSTFGRTCNEKNYIQVLSLATQRALVDLFNSRAFRAALAGTP